MRIGKVSKFPCDTPITSTCINETQKPKITKRTSKHSNAVPHTQSGCGKKCHLKKLNKNTNLETLEPANFYLFLC